MIGWDFSNFWKIGQIILSGGNPYSVAYSWYPPAASLLFAVFGWMPFNTAYLVWSGINISLYLLGLRLLNRFREWWLWILYTPFLFILLSGQFDIPFFCATAIMIYLTDDARSSKYLKGRVFIFLQDWGPAIMGAFLTLKPQLAAVVLPWFLIRWLRNNRPFFMRWFAITVGINLIPLLYNLNIYNLWISTILGVGQKKMEVSAGIFGLGVLGIPDWLLWISSISLYTWSLFRSEKISRAGQLTAFPISAWYDAVLLAGSCPAWFMVLLGWIALGLALAVRNNVPMIVIPLGALIWLTVSDRYRMRKSD